jgi:CheY-like chemotaxis protein
MPCKKRGDEAEHFGKCTTQAVGDGPTVLVVDDDGDTRETMSEILRDEGFRVRTARDGTEALALAARLPRPFAMLLDLSMPKMGGREVLRWLRSCRHLANMAVCIVSGDDEMPPGADLVMQKPLLVHQLVRVLAWLRARASEVSNLRFADVQGPVTVAPR